MERKRLLVNFRTVRAQKCTERDVAVRGAISLAVNAVGIVAILIDLPLEISADLWRLGVAHHGWGARWRRRNKRLLIHCRVRRRSLRACFRHPLISVFVRSMV